MRVTKEELITRYSAMDTEQLLELRCETDLTDVAAIAMGMVLSKRGVKLPKRKKIKYRGISKVSKKVDSILTGLFVILGIPVIIVAIIAGLGYLVSLFFDNPFVRWPVIILLGAIYIFCQLMQLGEVFPTLGKFVVRILERIFGKL